MKNAVIRLLVSLGILVEREAGVTLDDIEGHLLDAADAKQAYLDSLQAAEDTVNEHNELASQKIGALTTSITNIQKDVDAANLHLAQIQKAKAAA